jgi:glycosyltransferase involved in cell wall biosynthesis
LIVAGAGDDLDRCRALAASLGLGDACEFAGYVDEARKRELLQSAWVFASASSIEGWGIAAIEANACATPAVVFDVPGLREAVIDGVNGVIVRDRQALGDALLSVLTDRAWRERLEAGSLERSRAFSWDTSAREFLTMLMRDTLGAGSGLMQIDGNWVLVSSLPARKQ